MGCVRGVSRGVSADAWACPHAACPASPRRQENDALIPAFASLQRPFFFSLFSFRKSVTGRGDLPDRLIEQPIRIKMTGDGSRCRHETITPAFVL